MSLFTLDKKEGTKFYVPTVSNKPLKCTDTDSDEFCIEIDDEFWVNTKGHTDKSPNPVVFPYSENWFKTLSATAPNLEAYDDSPEPDYNQIFLELRKLVTKVILFGSDISYDDAIKDLEAFIEDDDESTLQAEHKKSYWKYNIPINPYTFTVCKTVEDYFKVPSRKMPF